MKGRLIRILLTLTHAVGWLFEWWGTELAGLVPSRWRVGLLGWTPPLLLRIDAGGARLERADGTVLLRPTPGEAPALERTRMPVWIELPESSGLRRTISLPLRAESDLAAVLEFEIDRQTPFSLDQVWHGCRIVARDAKNGVLSAELCATPRSRAEAALSQVESWGLSPIGLSVAGGPAIDLLPRARRHDRSWRDEPWKLVAGVNLLVLALGLAAIGGYQAITADRLEKLVAERRDMAQRADALKQRLDAAGKAADFLSTRRAGPRPVEILAELSRLLPDQAWLYDVTLSDRSLRIAGFAASVPDVLDQIAAAKLFGDPRLASPVVHGGNDVKDRFEVTLTVRENPS